MGIRLIKFEDNKGIVKCNHIEKDNTINLLRSINEVLSSKIMINTLGTSGTIKALIGKYMSNSEKVQKPWFSFLFMHVNMQVIMQVNNHKSDKLLKGLII